jgi:hypothetical protein
VDLRRMRCSDGAGTRRGGPRNSMAPRVAFWSRRGRAPDVP